MKAVAFSVALVVLVAFEGIVLPCCCSDHPYLELSKYLTNLVLDERPDAETLEANVLSIHQLAYSQRTEYRWRPDNFKALAEASSALRDGGDAYLCDSDMLGNLGILVEAAMDYRKTPLNPNTNAEQLDQLLLKMKRMVRGRATHLSKEDGNF